MKMPKLSTKARKGHGRHAPTTKCDMNEQQQIKEGRKREQSVPSTCNRLNGYDWHCVMHDTSEQCEMEQCLPTSCRKQGDGQSRSSYSPSDPISGEEEAGPNRRAGPADLSFWCESSTSLGALGENGNRAASCCWLVSIGEAVSLCGN